MIELLIVLSNTSDSYSKSNQSFFFVQLVVGQVTVRHKKSVVFVVVVRLFVHVSLVRIGDAFAVGLVFPLVVRVDIVVD